MTSGTSAVQAHKIWALAAVLIVAILVGAGLYVFSSLRALPGDAVQAGRDLLGDLESVAAAFSQGTIEIRFTSYATTVAGTSRLQFATLRQMEEYERSDRASLLWGTLELPEIVVSATAPVEYSYYLDLDEEWVFTLEDDVMTVEAPRIRFNRPSINVSQIEYEVERASLLRDEDAALEALSQGLTLASWERARENIPQVREVGRTRTREFVENWLIQGFGDGGDYRVEVIFADEKPTIREVAPE